MTTRDGRWEPVVPRSWGKTGSRTKETTSELYLRHCSERLRDTGNDTSSAGTRRAPLPERVLGPETRTRVHVRVYSLLSTSRKERTGGSRVVKKEGEVGE